MGSDRLALNQRIENVSLQKWESVRNSSLPYFMYPQGSKRISLVLFFFPLSTPALINHPFGEDRFDFYLWQSWSYPKRIFSSDAQLRSAFEFKLDLNKNFGSSSNLFFKTIILMHLMSSSYFQVNNPFTVLFP